MEAEMPRFCAFALLCGLTMFLGCGDSTDEPAGVSGGDDDNDDGGPNPNSGLYSEECDVDYGIDMGCDQGEAACLHAYQINRSRYDHPAESDCARALKFDAKVGEVALAHSQDMCDRHFFDHVNPDGKDPFDRLDAAGIDWVAAGENIFTAYGYTLEQIVTLAEEEFMDEPECTLNHRSNILSRDFSFVGVGIVECDDGYIYLTQDYVTYDYGDIRTDEHEYCPNFN
jgi:hypothetical protein